MNKELQRSGALPAIAGSSGATYTMHARQLPNNHHSTPSTPTKPLTTLSQPISHTSKRPPDTMPALLTQTNPPSLFLAQAIGLTASGYLLGTSRPRPLPHHPARPANRSPHRPECRSLAERRTRSDAGACASSRKAMVYRPDQRRLLRPTAGDPEWAGDCVHCL